MTVRHEDGPALGSPAMRRCDRLGLGLAGAPGPVGKRQGRAVNWDDAITDAAVSDTGMRRSNNQDSFTVVRASSPDTWRQRGHVFIVADGMGAHAVGELASKLACDNIPHNYMKTKAGPPAEAIVKAYRDVGAIIHSKASANKDFQGMGTTCSTLVLLPEGALLAHVGDSRIYRIRKNRIDQLTFDHSLVWELVRRHALQPDEANLRVPKNVITRSLGPDPSVEVDIEGPLAVEPNDVYLLCSDGLSGLVSDPELGAIAGNFHPKEACRYLVQLANLRGGHDNITVVLLRVGSWIEPDSAQDVPIHAPPDVNGRAPGGLKAAFASLFRGRGRTHTPEPVEKEPYRSAECPVSEELVNKLGELTRKVQAAAVEQAWSLDWTALTTFRRKETEARAAGNLRGALKYSGEIIELLGKAARFHRKAGGPAGVA